MPFDSIIWDLDDDPDGNVQHCAEHGASKDEVEEVLLGAEDEDVSRSSGRPVAFGDTKEIEEGVVYPVTAYEAPRR